MTEEKLLTTKELSEYLGVTLFTLCQYRSTGTGPNFIKLGRMIRYKPSDVRDWLDSKKVA